MIVQIINSKGQGQMHLSGKKNQQQFDSRTEWLSQVKKQNRKRGHTQVGIGVRFEVGFHQTSFPSVQGRHPTNTFVLWDHFPLPLPFPGLCLLLSLLLFFRFILIECSTQSMPGLFFMPSTFHSHIPRFCVQHLRIQID